MIRKNINNQKMFTVENKIDYNNIPNILLTSTIQFLSKNSNKIIAPKENLLNYPVYVKTFITIKDILYYLTNNIILCKIHYMFFKKKKDLNKFKIKFTTLETIKVKVNLNFFLFYKKADKHLNSEIIIM